MPRKPEPEPKPKAKAAVKPRPKPGFRETAWGPRPVDWDAKDEKKLDERAPLGTRERLEIEAGYGTGFELGQTMSRLRPPSDEDVVLVVGMRGTGKSTWAKRQVAHWPGPKIAFDPHDEWSVLGTPSERHELGPLEQRLTLPELQELLEIEPDFLWRDDLSLAVVVRADIDGATEDLATFAALVDQVDGILVIIDEVSLTFEGSAQLYRQLATQSRHVGQPLVLISQWMTAIPISCRRQATVIAAHRQYTPLDLDAASEWMGDAKGQSLRALRKYERILFILDEGLDEAPSTSRKAA